MAATASTAYCQGSGARGRAGRRADDGADGRRPGAVEEGPRPLVSARSRSNRSRAEQDERERRSERDERREQAAADPGGRVADDRDGLHHRARGDLAERDRVEELPAVIQW